MLLSSLFLRGQTRWALRLVASVWVIMLPALTFGQHTSNASKANSSTAKTTTSHQVAYATRNLERGTILSATDIRWADTSHLGTLDTKAPGHPLSVAPGWVARRTIRENELLQPPTVSPPDAVLTGSAINAQYHRDDITVRISATAIGRGAIGDTIYIRTQNRKRFRAVITDTATVDIIP